MSSFTTFQNQGSSVSSSLSSSSVNHPSPSNHPINTISTSNIDSNNTSFAFPPLPAQSFSCRNSPIRRKPLPPGVTVPPLSLGSSISEQFPKPPTHKPFASRFGPSRGPLAVAASDDLSSNSVPPPPPPPPPHPLQPPEKSVTADQNRCGMTCEIVCSLDTQSL